MGRKSSRKMFAVQSWNIYLSFGGCAEYGEKTLPQKLGMKKNTQLLQIWHSLHPKNVLELFHGNVARFVGIAIVEQITPKRSTKRRNRNAAKRGTGTVIGKGGRFWSCENVCFDFSRIMEPFARKVWGPYLHHRSDLIFLSDWTKKSRNCNLPAFFFLETLNPLIQSNLTPFKLI